MKKLIALTFALFGLYSCQKDDLINEPINLEIGQFYQGGIIFYLDSTGEHGFVAAENDQATNIPWSCQGNFYGITATEIGAGRQNTLDIIISFEVDNSCTVETYAAKVCQDLVLEGYSDWFLPSFEELNLMHENRLIIDNFADWIYWSSTELDPQIQADQNWTRVRFFGPDGNVLSGLNNAGKGNLHNVRAIREF